MLSDHNAELEHRITLPIARQLSPRHRSLSLADSALLAKYAIDAADEANVPIVFSLVDAYGQQRYFFSMDNALLISHTLAGQKAWTAVALKMPTHRLAAQVKARRQPLWPTRQTGDLLLWRRIALLVRRRTARRYRHQRRYGGKRYCYRQCGANAFQS